MNNQVRAGSTLKRGAFAYWVLCYVGSGPLLLGQALWGAAYRPPRIGRKGGDVSGRPEERSEGLHLHSAETAGVRWAGPWPQAETRQGYCRTKEVATVAQSLKAGSVPRGKDCGRNHLQHVTFSLLQAVLSREWPTQRITRPHYCYGLWQSIANL